MSTPEQIPQPIPESTSIPEQGLTLENATAILFALQSIANRVSSLPDQRLEISTEQATAQFQKGETVELIVVFNAKDHVPIATPPQTQPSELLATSINSQENKEKIRRVLEGRIGYNPQFAITKTENLMAHFSLAVSDKEQDNPHKVRWEKILAFGDRAEQVREENLKTGDYVEVVGYEHEKERKGKMTKQIFAASITRKDPPQRKPKE